MKKRPILMSAPMVRALLDGSKTQTRRMLKMPHGLWETSPSGELVPIPSNCPYGQPGDRLWVRESFSGPYCMEAQDGMAAAAPSTWVHESRIWYWADGQPTHGDWTRPRPSIHMPRWASRITLEVTDVRVERLQDISEADAIAEGCPPNATNAPDDISRFWYRLLWDQINGPGSWDANPWVWCVTFSRLGAA